MGRWKPSIADRLEDIAASLLDVRIGAIGELSDDSKSPK